MADEVLQLMARIDAHEIEGAAIQSEADALGLDAKRLKAIRAAKKTLDALLVIDPATAEAVRS